MGIEQPDRFRDVVLESQTLHHVRPGRHCRRIRRILDREPSMLILRPALRHLGSGDGPKLARGFARWRLAGLQQEILQATTCVSLHKEGVEKQSARR